MYVDNTYKTTTNNKNEKDNILTKWNGNNWGIFL
jgi:hypothetical protein